LLQQDVHTTPPRPTAADASPAVCVEDLSHTYPAANRKSEPRRALTSVSFSVREGELFCLLGPNGSGKSTLFKILSTLIAPTSGKVTLFGHDAATEQASVRRLLGVAFQHPSLDAKLTAGENLLHQGHLYGLRGAALASAITDHLTKVGLLDRAGELVERLSGGMQRRVELAKALLHHPRLLILDEPSTGLDPGARREFIDYLRELRVKEGITVLLTTHLLDEADRCDRIAIMDRGTIVALGTPKDLKHEIGGDIISLTSSDPVGLSTGLATRFGGAPSVVDGTVRIERKNGHEFIPQIVEAFPGLIDAITVAKPTLEDVFIRKTGHRFWTEEA
jgi:ABC-2 type transport system ATP-binding protein